ncbi:uncharacterized protein [Drosophila takahashii]|uniref:uncharacterized protein n=1 Tax=Drosophila takahashii TaxID=29030 RepID=UPI0038995471
MDPDQKITQVRDACRNCGAPGHFRRDCRNPRQYFCWDCGRRDVQSIGEPPVTGPLRVERGRIAAEVDLGGHVRLATIDTGASRSFISEDIADVVGQPHQFREIRTQINLADTSRVKVTRLLLADVTLARKTIQVPLLVMPGVLEPLILGMDFLASISTTLRCGTASLTLSRQRPREGQTIRYSEPRPDNQGSPSEPPPRRLVGKLQRDTATAAPKQQERVRPAPAVDNPFHLEPLADTAIAQKRNPFRTEPRLGIANHETEPQHDRDGPEKQHRVRETHCVTACKEKDANSNTGGNTSMAAEDHDRKHREEHAENPRGTSDTGTVSQGGQILNQEGKERGCENNPEVQAFLSEQLARFEGMAGVSNIAEHRVTMRDDRPIKQRYFPRNPAMQRIIDEQVDALLEQGCIEPSRSQHSVPMIPVAKDSRAFTAFTVPGRGLFQYSVIPFKLHSAPATFQRALDSVIGPDLDPYEFACLDDIIVIGASLGEHMDNLRKVFERLRRANLRINQEKCSFFKRKLAYLGHVISDQGIHTDPDKVAAVRNLSPPTSLRELRRCLGMASWYRRIVPHFASVVQPMPNLLKKNRRWKWESEQQNAQISPSR